MENNFTDIFIDSIFKLSKKTFSKHVIHQTKRCLLDYLGATLAGTIIQKEKIDKYLSFVETNQSESTIIGLRKKSNIYNSIFINGLNAHVADFDDGVNSGIIHLGSPIISAILTVGEKEKLTYNQILSGIIIGYESALRIAKLIQPYHKESGYHATSTCGVLGSALGISAALGFNENQMKDAFSAAAISSGGLLKAIEDNSELKPYNAARAALIGYISASMARAGFSGPNDVLSGENGFLEVFSNKINEKNFEFNDNTLAIEQVYFKPYAACRYCHPSIESTLKIRDRYDLDLNQIKQIKVSTYYWAVKNHDHIDIKGITSAKMSIPYSIAVTLMLGKAGINEFIHDNITNENILSLTKKVIVETNDEFTKKFPEQSSSLVKIEMNNGVTYSECVNYPKGEPENPLSDQELIDKFRSLATFAGKNQSEIDLMVEYVMDIENNLDKLFKLL